MKNDKDVYIYFKNQAVLDRYYIRNNDSKPLDTCPKCGGELQLFCWETHYTEKCEDCGEHVEMK